MNPLHTTNHLLLISIFWQVLKKMMDNTFSKRREWIHNTCPSIEDILTKFPPLSQGFKYVSYTCISWCIYLFLPIIFFFSVIFSSCGRSLMLLSPVIFPSEMCYENMG